MFIDKGLKEDCCGCTACREICPMDAISMMTDGHGFSYPNVDEAQCIHCNLCHKVCAFDQKLMTRANIRAYGVHHKSVHVRQQSRSGGAFYLLAEAVLGQHGIIWGAGFDESLNVVHMEVDQIEKLSQLQGSKYVQSDLGDCYSRIAAQLATGRKVLFSGTACQVAGLVSFIMEMKCDQTNLLTCDIICQGVPSTKIYADYRTYIEQKYHDRIKAFNFRDKTRVGWSGHEESFVLASSGKKIYSRCYRNYYYYYYMRPSCFSCRYTGLNRPADVTLGDFWGVKENYPKFADDIGNSLVLINTEKGQKLFEEASIHADIIEAELEKCLQLRLQTPSKKPSNYDRFWDDYRNKGFSHCIKHYCKESLKKQVRSSIVVMVKKTKKVLKKWN